MQQQLLTTSHPNESESWQNAKMVFLALTLIIAWAVYHWINRERPTKVYGEVEKPTASWKDKLTPEKEARITSSNPSQSNVRRRFFSPINKEDKSPKQGASSGAIKVEDISYKKKRIGPYGQVDELIFNPKPIEEEPQVPLRKEKSYTEPSVKTQPMEIEVISPQEVYPQQHVPIPNQPKMRPIDPIAQEKEDEKKRVELFNAILKGIELVRKKSQLNDFASVRNSKGVITIKKKIQERTPQHNTVCLVCFCSCHLSCNLPEIKEKGSSKFKGCHAFQMHHNCLMCKHHFSSHAHQRCIWKDVKETFHVERVESEYRQTMNQIDANAIFMLKIIYSLTEENVGMCIRIIQEQKYYYKNDQEMQGYLDDVFSQLQKAELQELRGRGF